MGGVRSRTLIEKNVIKIVKKNILTIFDNTITSSSDPISVPELFYRLTLFSYILSVDKIWSVNRTTLKVSAAIVSILVCLSNSPVIHSLTSLSLFSGHWQKG